MLGNLWRGETLIDTMAVSLRLFSAEETLGKSPGFPYLDSTRCPFDSTVVMDSPPPNSDALSRVEYWNTRYISEKDDLSEYEWFRTFDNLQPFFESNLPPASDEVRLIHLGCGLSVR